MYKLVAQMGFDENGDPWYEKIFLEDPVKQICIEPFSNGVGLLIAYIMLGKNLNHVNFNHEDAESQLVNAIQSEHPNLKFDVSDFIARFKENPLPFSPKALNGLR